METMTTIKVQYLDYNGGSHNKNFTDSSKYMSWSMKHNFLRITQKSVNGIIEFSRS